MASSRPAAWGRGRLEKTISAARATADTTAATVEAKAQATTRVLSRWVTTIAAGSRASGLLELATLDRPGMETEEVMLPLSDRLLSGAPPSALSGPSASCEDNTCASASAATAFTSPKPVSTL